MHANLLDRSRRGSAIVACSIVLLSFACAPRARIIEVTSRLESGPGSLREAIDAANASDKPVRIVTGFRAPVEVHVTKEMPAIAGHGIEFDSAGIRIVSDPCTRPDGRRGCSGLVVTGREIVLRNLDVSGFLFDGVAVRSTSASDVRIVDSHLHDNKDDGIGISNGAVGVTVARCRIEGNGFRTKGKGVLVFDRARARLVDNVIRRNRDGVTVSKFARVEMIGNVISENYDKGLGVSGAAVAGRNNEILANGRPDPERDRVPNGDGLRATLTSNVSLEDTTIAGNGDSAVVVLNDSQVDLWGAELTGNGGVAVFAADSAIVRLRNVVLRDNAEPEMLIKDEARVERDDY